jgi:hypothetical protein
MEWIEAAVARAARELVNSEVAVPFPRAAFGPQGVRERGARPPLDFRWIVNYPLFALACGDRELGGGSMRIHQPDLLGRILGMIGQAGANAPVVEALGYGAPPHGGFTLALDGLAALFSGARSIRSVIPFPKTAAGRCPIFSRS